MAGRNSNAKPADPNAPKLSPEESEALKRKLESAFRVFDRRWRGYADKKDRQNFLCRVIHLDDEPSMQEDNFGDVRMRSLVKVELIEKGMEGIRFQDLLTDNPANNTVQNPKAVLNHLVRATTGRSIPESGPFNWDTNEVVGQLVYAVIERGGEKNQPDNRGNFYSQLKDFARYVPPVEDEEDETPVPASSPKPAEAKRAPRKAAPAEDPELDDVPF